MELFSVQLVDGMLDRALVGVVGLGGYFDQSVVAETCHALAQKGAPDLVSIEVLDDIQRRLRRQRPVVLQHPCYLTGAWRYLDQGRAPRPNLVRELAADPQPKRFSQIDHGLRNEVTRNGTIGPGAR